VGDALKPCFATLAAVAVLASGCGGGAASGEGDPASAVPPDALVYTEVVVRPEGSLQDDARDAAAKVLRTDRPEDEIREHLDLALEDLDYDRDVEPWLGERAGFWLRPTERDGAFGALLLAATDTDLARESLEASLERSGETVTERSHRGSDYLVTDDGDAAGIVGDFVVIGPEAAYQRTVDASEGDSLAEVDEYADAVDALEVERLAHFWVDTGALIEVGARQDPDAAAQLDQLSAIVPLDDLPPIAGSFTANGDALGLGSRCAARAARCSAPAARRCSRSCRATRGPRSAPPTWASRCATRSTTSRARSAGSASATRCATRPGSTSTATCSTGSATPASSCAVRRRRRSTAAS
jgi:hypothetical protein